MNRLETLRARLTVWYVWALTLALTAFAFLLYGWLSQTLYRHHDGELLANSDQIARLLADVPLDEASVANALRRIDAPPRLLLVRDHHGELIYRSPLLQVAEPSIGHHEALVHAAANAPRDPEFFTVTLERSGAVRFICTPIDRSPAAYVQVGNALGDVPATLHAVAIASMILVPLVVLFTSFGGWIIAGRALEPIQTIDATLRAIEATDLSRRVEVHPGDRELGGLVGTINGLLARLEHAFGDLRDFAADASHQLQTPLTVMKSTIELARTSPAQLPPAVLDDLEEEVDDMSTLVADLQSLSLADADAQGSSRAEVDFSTVCADAAEILEALAEAKDLSVQVDVSPNVIVHGEPAKLKQMVLNLGDNAIKYTPAGGRVAVKLYAEATFAVLEVADTGVGIPEQDLPRVFDRFYRASSGGANPGGTGLGLAIAKRIIEVHHGDIAVVSLPSGGTQFTVRLPIVLGRSVKRD
ncbi:MAG: HAMP domain-containing histidine kinase [Acidobacteria bacterium]|nr:HAMP domain-containing histidine kinase [Acidobacteriota bacterium]